MEPLCELSRRLEATGRTIPRAARATCFGALIDAAAAVQRQPRTVDPTQCPAVVRTALLDALAKGALATEDVVDLLRRKRFAAEAFASHDAASLVLCRRLPTQERYEAAQAFAAAICSHDGLRDACARQLARAAWGDLGLINSWKVGMAEGSPRAANGKRSASSSEDGGGDVDLGKRLRALERRAADLDRMATVSMAGAAAELRRGLADVRRTLEADARRT